MLMRTASRDSWIHFHMLLICISALLYLCEAGVVFQEHGYSSQPAAFGKTFQLGKEYAARVQQIADDPYLCGIDQSGNYTKDLPKRRQELVVVPPNGLPVALLAEKGNCSYDRKARVAMQYGPVGVVQYVIVYDNEQGDNNTLETMFPTGDSSGITIGLQFISYHSGMAIKNQMKKEHMANEGIGGPKMFMNSYTEFHAHYRIGCLFLFAALSYVGCCGYFLYVHGKDPEKDNDSRRPSQIFPVSFVVIPCKIDLNEPLLDPNTV